MPDCRAMYFQLAARVADALALLAAAQQQGEGSYVEDEDADTVDSPAPYASP